MQEEKHRKKRHKYNLNSQHYYFNKKKDKIYNTFNRRYYTYNLDSLNLKIDNIEDDSCYLENNIKDNEKEKEKEKENEEINNNDYDVDCNIDIMELTCPCLNYSIKKKNLRKQGYMVDKPYDYDLYPGKYGSIQTHGWYDVRIYYKYSSYYVLREDGKYYYYEY
jgi:hypothetical protein